MRIRDKRSAYFRLNETQSPYPELRFVYLDGIPGGEIDAMFVSLDSTVGEKLSHFGVKEIDADRPFMLFTGDAYGSAPNLTVSSSIGATYNGTSNSGDGGDGSAALIIPGLKCGDFVTISAK